ncbi:MAG: hypothetical protein BYD32DRAFT_464370 [Podila humilis]|nr:MAG: hypothetical protein BYD32DRAFT_464370 [Podila humilis]
MNRHSDPDQHWFSFVHLADFHKRTFPLYTRYAFMLTTIVFSLLLLLGEIYISVALLLYKNWVPGVFHVGLIESTTPSTTPTAKSTSPVIIDMLDRVGSSAGWIVVGSTGLSVCILIWDWVQARSIVESDSIPRAFLNSTAFRLWSIKSYSHFCLLSQIQWGRGLRQRVVMAVYFGLQGK